ncbi:polysaccharide lyase family 8 super-sandwich domain-containing protein [Aestuariivivens insulae]|uniref:polysaccharide lyase family 8 super-sandwich domain-containing protein n=1 Tax=Aestuariivivens insulae TaxID=1621988 RepID=UPI001F5AF463|nr:polysaccharide lyase family 8 super-sandwich domain-containing protein [Aestuariivivens insulae]
MKFIHKLIITVIITSVFSAFPQCSVTVTPDLSLTTSNASIETEIETMFNRFATAYLGTGVPSLTSANSTYDGLKIGQGGEKSISTWGSQSWGFLKTYVQYLRNATSGTATYIDVETKVNNVIEWASDQFCAGTLAVDGTGYAYDDFGRAASLCIPNLTQAVKDKFAYTLYVQTDNFGPLFVANYDEAYQTNNGTIVTDVIYTIGDGLLAYCLTYPNTADERYRYMRSFKRYMERFFSYTTGARDGLKPDGSGFHHAAAYNNYMYAYKTAASILSYMDDTEFQVSSDSYKVFRDAVYAQYIQANDYGHQALSTAGRNPEARSRQFGLYNLRALAISGGKILGLSTADPILAGMYNRIHGVYSSFNYSTIAPFESGFFQFNHTSAGAFRKETGNGNDWVAFNKGFVVSTWGSEIYKDENRYGRYQSYGALEILYPGDKSTGNGYNVESWDWNYNPGTTVIHLPWDKLHAEAARLDERQQKRFAGALALDKKNNGVLDNNHGIYGMFAMDFQEQEGLAWSTPVYSSTSNHNNTFVFKKSTFFLDDFIVSLGSGIGNDDSSNPTITTLYQRMDNNGDVYLNGSVNNGTINISGANNWLMSNYATGFYIVSNATIKGMRVLNQTPNENQTDPSVLTGSDYYYISYLDHGKQPSNAGYEYIVKPNTTTSEMTTLHTTISGGNKPYTVHQKDANAHILEYHAQSIWGYAFFNTVSNLSYDYVKGVNASCLVMTKYDSSGQQLRLSVVNPDVGITGYKSYAAVNATTRQVTLQGKWSLGQAYNNVQDVTPQSSEDTVIEFTLKDGLSSEVLLNPAALGVEDYNEQNVIKVYPNPAKNSINIRGLESNRLYSVSIVSLLGQYVGHVQVINNQINISNIQNGIYFLRLQLDGGKTVTKKILVEK